MIRNTDYLRHIIAPTGGQGGVAMSYLCPHCNSFPMKDYAWWVSGGKSIQIGGVRYVEKNMTGRNQTGFWWCKQAKVLTRPRSSKRMRYLRAYVGIWSMRSICWRTSKRMETASSEGCPEVPVRESSDELTLRAEALGSRASMSTTWQKGGGVLLWWMLIGTPSAKRYKKASKEKTGKSFMMTTKK